MVIDGHVHFFIPGTIPQKYVEGCARTITMAAQRELGVEINLEDARGKLFPMLLDEKGEAYLKLMDEAEIDKAVIFGVDFGEEIGEPEIPIVEMNRRYCGIVKAHPDRFVALCAIDPRRKGALEHVTQCVEEFEMRGIKLHPAAGFNPVDPVMYPFYERCAQWGLPLLFHSGAQPAAPVALETSRPVYIAEAAGKFPATKFIVAHFGMEWWHEAVMFGRLLPNVYFDCSYWQLLFGKYPDEYYHMLRKFADCGPEKVIWGTDNPLPNAMMSPKDWLNAHVDPKTEISFSQEEIEMMTGSNARKMFKI